MNTDESTLILQRVNRNEAGAQEFLVTAVYRELRRLAASQMRKERSDHTLQPTALANEAYIRLFGGRTPNWQNRAHFFGAAAKAMRRILVDYARKTKAQRRPGERVYIDIERLPSSVISRAAEVLAVDEALDRLERVSSRQSTVVEMRYFIGMKEKEIAEVLQVSLRTVKRDWQVAQAWLSGEMSPR